MKISDPAADPDGDGGSSGVEEVAFSDDEEERQYHARRERKKEMRARNNHRRQHSSHSSVSDGRQWPEAKRARRSHGPFPPLPARVNLATAEGLAQYLQQYGGG